VAFGDSLTDGLGVDRRRNYPARLQTRLAAAGYDYEVVNAGVSGETSAQGLERVDSICAINPAIVIVEFGINDQIHGVPSEITCRNLAQIVSRLQLSHALVVVAGMKISSRCGSTQNSNPNDIYAEVAQDFNVPLIPDFLKGVAENPQLNQKDGMHPTAQGYGMVVENVWDVLQPILGASAQALTNAKEGPKEGQSPVYSEVRGHR
jgi:acyl-CoA thioesterase-1